MAKTLQSVVGSGAVPPIALIGRRDTATATVVTDIQDHIKPTNSTTTSTSWIPIVAYTGSGMLEFVALEQETNASSLDIDCRLLIDGVNVLEFTDLWTSSAEDDTGIAFIGGISGGTDKTGMAYSEVKFNTSFSLDYRASGTASLTMRGYVRYRKDS